MDRMHRAMAIVLLFIGTACVLLARIVVAQEITIDRFAGLGARAMGMGGAYTAVAEDFTALYWNPAGLAQIRRIEFYTALSHQRDQARTTFFGTPRTTELSKTRLSALGVVLPAPTYRGSLVFSFGFNRVKSFDTAFGKEGFRTAQVYESERSTDEGGLGIYSLGGAIDVSPSVSLGLALNLWDGKEILARTLVHTDTLNARREEMVLSLEDEYRTNVNFKLAALIRTPVGLRFGLTLDTPVTHQVKENWRQEIDNDVDRGYWNYKVSLPYQFGLGASWMIPHLLTIAADAVYNDWKQTRYDHSPQEGVTNEDFETKYKDVWRVHLGGEVLLPVVPIHVRLGFYRDPIPFFGPRGPEDPKIEITRDRKYITLGAGTLIDQVLALDVAWVRGTSTQTEGHTTEKHEDRRVFMSAAYRF